MPQSAEAMWRTLTKRKGAPTARATREKTPLSACKIVFSLTGTDTSEEGKFVLPVEIHIHPNVDCSIYEFS